ncbi:MAG: ABC transporter substrate-binding protein [Geminicoccaceae bacterium]|nr:ABC transporter substrate-binding protein [Geminicoccaceae bacterium]
MTGRMVGAACVALLLAAGAARAEDTLSVGMVLEPPVLDPTASAAAAVDEIVYANVFEGLVRIGPDGGVRPGLARSWTVDGTGTVYTFDLEENVLFQDGTGFDADDVLFTFKRAMAPDSTNAQKTIFDPIEKVEALDPDTVRITLKESRSDFLFNMGQGDAVIVAEESAKDNRTHPVGTGPFKVVEWRKGDSVRLQRRDDYWGEPVALREVTFHFIADPTAASSAMLAGDVDAYPNFPAPESLDLLKTDPRLKVVVGTTEGETILAINNRRPPLNDVRVRRAISYAIDRQAVIQGAYFGYGTPIGSHFAPHDPAYVDLTGLYPHDFAKARDLLKEAGVENLKLTMKLPPPSYARRGGEIVAAELKEAGIEVEVVAVEWAQWLEQVFQNHDFDLTIVSHTEPRDINIYARDDYYFGYDSQAFKDLMAKADAATDVKTRDDFLKQAQRKIAEDAVNAFLFQLPKLGVWNARVEGLWTNSPIQANDLTAVHWAE